MAANEEQTARLQRPVRPRVETRDLRSRARAVPARAAPTLRPAAGRLLATL